MGVGAKTKAYLKNVEEGWVKSFRFNPEYTDSQKWDYGTLQSPCSSYPRFQYTAQKERTISFTLKVYGHQGEPQQWVDWLSALKPRSTWDSPRRVIFAYGNDVRTCVMTNLQRHFKEFDENLNLVDVEFDITLLEV